MRGAFQKGGQKEDTYGSSSYVGVHSVPRDPASRREMPRCEWEIRTCGMSYPRWCSHFWCCTTPEGECFCADHDLQGIPWARARSNGSSLLGEKQVLTGVAVQVRNCNKR